MKKIYNGIIAILRETAAQTFTILGFAISWFLLTGTAKDIVGIMILISFGVWFATINFRKF
tara:strand:- start:444 stop:626 length:183 start_codon:yes stop_codon:yes gene_type:complete